MLIGLYLVMPILGAWLGQVSRQDVKRLLYVWGVSLLLPYVKMAAPLLGYTGNFGNMGLLGVCDWNAFGTFYYVSGFTGYLLLAYYLVKYPLDWSWRRTLIITVPMFAAGYLITSLGFVLTQAYFPGNYANLEIVWLFTGINVFMMTFPVFVIVQKLRLPASPRLSQAVSLSFGVYLCHFIFVQMAYDWFDGPLPTLVRILAMAVSAFALSYLLVWVMFRFKSTRRFVK